MGHQTHLSYAEECLGNMRRVPKHARTWEMCMWLHLLWAVEGGEIRARL